MQITFKLYASLTQYLPAEARTSNRVPLELPEGSSVAQVIEPFGLPEKLVHLVLVNGVYVPPEQRLSRVLEDGDVLAIWPPIAGRLSRCRPTTPRDFEREMGCTEAELLRWLPGAVNGHALALLPRSAEVAIDAGRLELALARAAAAPDRADAHAAAGDRLPLRRRRRGRAPGLHALLRPLHAARRRLRRQPARGAASGMAAH